MAADCTGFALAKAALLYRHYGARRAPIHVRHIRHVDVLMLLFTITVLVTLMRFR